jgi:Peptidase family M28
VAGGAPARDDLADMAKPGLAAIRGDAIAAHVRFLAVDLLEGRGTGTRGHALAARHVASGFRALGLSPAGKDGSYLLEVPLRATTLDPAGSSVRVGEQALDTVYNGAIDNAGGVAAILEIARGFASLRPPPARSILFLAVTAEEKGWSARTTSRSTRRFPATGWSPTSTSTA